MSVAAVAVEPAAPALPNVAPGCEVIYGQPDHEYRAAEGVSQSELKEILKSPAHYMARYGPNALPFYPSALMTMGTALHALTLEPESFSSNFCSRADVAKEPTVPELKDLLNAAGISFKGTALKGELLALMYPEGLPKDPRTTLAPEDYAAVGGMAAALQDHSTAGAWFDPTRRNYRRGNEVSIYVSAEASPLGFPMKGRIDRLERTSTGWRILDLKSTDNASTSQFMRKTWELSYDIQAAYYSWLVALALGGDVEFLFCAVERKAPHGIGLYRASESLLVSGEARVRRAAAEMSFCLQTNNWPGYSDEIQDLVLPAWAKDSAAPELDGF
jgi:hypothetical protein